MKDEAVSVFLDTNALLHFERFDQIDWVGLTGARHCTLVVAPILLRELEKNKVFNNSRKLRDRAASLIAYLASLMDRENPVIIREHVSIEFIDHDALVDFGHYRLVRDLADDQLIASAIEFQIESNRKTMIASDDSGLRIKLRSRPVGALRLPDAARLPSIIDVERSELLELKRQLARLQTRAPRLSLVFDDGSQLLRVSRTECPDPPPHSLQQVIAAHPVRPLPPEERYDRYNELLGGSSGGIMLVRMVAERHNEELERYYSRYRKFLRKYDAWQLAMQTMYEIGFVLKNGGSGPATNVDVRIVFPGHIKLVDPDEFPIEPDEPAVPSTSDSDFISPVRSPFLQTPLIDNILPHFDGRPSFEKGGHVLEYDAGTLKHGCDLICEPVLFQVPIDQFNPFELAVSVTYNEGDKVEQKLPVVFES